MPKARVKSGAIKPTVPDAKKDLTALEEAMNSNTIAKRQPGEEVQAANERGARVAITPDKSKDIEGGITKGEIARGKKKDKGPKSAPGVAVQTEIKGVVPKLDAVAKLAKKVVEAVKQIGDWTNARGDRETALIKAMKKSRRLAVNIDGYTLNLDHRGAVDKLKIQKPK
jgi:hypothetical protein